MSKFNGHPEWAIGRGRSKIPYAVPSGGVLDLRAFDGKLVHVNSTAIITTVLAPPNGECMVVFDTACTLTYSTALLLPGAANITTSAGDCMQVVDEDGVAARIVSYLKANGSSILAGLTPLGTITPTVSANVDFLTTFTALFDNYLVIGDGVLPTADGSLAVRLANAGSADAGSNYFSPANYSGAAFTTSATSINLCQGGNILAAGIGSDFELRIKNANDATRLKVVTGELAYQLNATPGYAATHLQSVYSAANAVSGFRLFFVAGQNFAAVGKIRVYGYNN